MSHRISDTADSLADAVRQLNAHAATAFRNGFGWGIASGAILGATIMGAILV